MRGILRELHTCGSKCRRLKFRMPVPLVNWTETRKKAIEGAMSYELKNLESLIDNILQDEGPMTLADLINLIAQPHSYEDYCLIAG